MYRLKHQTTRAILFRVISSSLLRCGPWLRSKEFESNLCIRKDTSEAGNEWQWGALAKAQLSSEINSVLEDRRRQDLTNVTRHLLGYCAVSGTNFHAI